MQLRQDACLEDRSVTNNHDRWLLGVWSCDLRDFATTLFDCQFVSRKKISWLFRKDIPSSYPPPASAAGSKPPLHSSQARYSPSRAACPGSPP